MYKLFLWSLSELRKQEKKKHKQEKPIVQTADLVEQTPVVYGLANQKSGDGGDDEDSLKQTVKVRM